MNQLLAERVFGNVVAVCVMMDSNVVHSHYYLRLCWHLRFYEVHSVEEASRQAVPMNRTNAAVLISLAEASAQIGSVVEDETMLIGKMTVWWLCVDEDVLGGLVWKKKKMKKKKKKKMKMMKEDSHSQRYYYYYHDY